MTRVDVTNSATDTEIIAVNVEKSKDKEGNLLKYIFKKFS